MDYELFQKGSSRLPKVLKMFGYDSLRKGQDKVVMNILAGRDVITILPTGAGKTSCFVIPALCQEWPTLVFSPLQALMRDQCKNLWKVDVPAARLSGDQTDAENMESIRAWRNGQCNILFVAPERMQNKHFQEAMQVRPPVLVAVDEAHTISEWSDNFRPDYAKIGNFLERYGESVQVVAAFSATLPPTAEEDVRRVLDIPNAARIKYYPRRKNLKLTSSDRNSEWDLLHKLKECKGPTIVYCATRKNVESVAHWLSLRSDLRDKVAPYHAGISPHLRREYQDDFMENRRPVIVATNAFGMGVDKSDVRGVIHWDFPSSLEALSQETGRGGRDGGDTICHTFNSQEALRIQEFLLDTSNPDSKKVRQVFNIIQQACGRSPGGICELGNKDIAIRAKIMDTQVSACLSYLKSCGAIEREKKKELIGYVRFPKEDVPGDSERLQRAEEVSDLFHVYRQIADRIGTLTDKGFNKVDMTLWADQLQVQEATLRTNIKKWERLDLVTFVPPFSGIQTKLIGTENDVDWDRIDRKRRDNVEKLYGVVDYFKHPDSEKHDYLEAYFKGDA